MNITKWTLILLFSFTYTVQADYCRLKEPALKEAVEIRQLKVKKKVPCYVKTKAEIKEYLIEVVDKYLTDEKLANEAKLYKALGLIPQDYAYKEGMIDLYTANLAGFYEPEDEYFVMAGWQPEILQFPIAVHELTHALQDQHFDLDNLRKPAEQTTDEALALAGLIEGDASAVMYDYAHRQRAGEELKDKKSISDLVFQMVLSIKIQNSKLDAPEFLKSVISFPYISGLSFAFEHLKKKGYQGLDKMYKKPPLTTKEILLPSLYPLDSFKELENKRVEEFFKLDSRQTTYRDRLGAFVLSAIMLDKSEIKPLAQHWQNDLAIINNDQVYFLIEFDQESIASQFKKEYEESYGGLYSDLICQGRFVGIKYR